MESITTAPAAGSMGFVRESRASRRSSASPAADSPRSRNRRAARTSGDAVTKIFTSASGNTTVAMSRPSITAPRSPSAALGSAA